jgi:CpeT protein
MIYKLLLIPSILILLLGSCNRQKGITTNSTSSASTSVAERKMDSFTYLKKCMQGNFSSANQSKSDSSYFDIRLRMEPIWPEKQDAYYLYVEQAMSNALDKPYRVRIYKVVRENDQQFTSYIYKLNDQSRFIGKMGNDPVFNSITPDSLHILNGCEVRLTFDHAKWTFTGSTGEKTCPSDRNGASYTSSKVNLNDERMISWDQGWNSEGKQVWGAIKGGYIFEKID